MILTFNELSCNKDFLDNKSARNLINNFILLMKEIENQNILDECILTEDFFASDNISNYNFSKWLKDDSVDRIHKQFFRRFMDKRCTYVGASNVNGDFSIIIGEKKYESIGCAFAIERETDILSLPTNDAWNHGSLTGEYVTIANDFDDEILDFKNVVLNNIPTTTSIDAIIAKYKKELQNNITSGQDLWESREKLYPNLIFCSNVKNQLFEDSEKFHIISVMKKLNEFQKYFSEYDGKYDPNKLGMGARTESESVKKNPELRNLRLFTKPDGTKDYFYDHVGFNGKYSAGRIHFLPDDKKRMCYIGYIGRHLPTKKY